MTILSIPKTISFFAFSTLSATSDLDGASEWEATAKSKASLCFPNCKEIIFSNALCSPKKYSVMSFKTQSESLLHTNGVIVDINSYILLTDLSENKRLKSQIL